MIKTIKGKVVAGVMVVALVSGGGAALGATDAGAKLKTWYDGQFGKSSLKVGSDSDTYLKSGLDGLQLEVDGLKDGSTTKILATKDTEVASSTDKIDKKAQEYIDSIASKKKEIEGYMDKQFVELKTDADEKIFKAGTDFSAQAHSELETLTKDTGIVARKSVQIELGAVKERVVGEIEEAINKAKADLQSQLNTNANATIDEIKGMVDKRVGDVRIFITSATNFMIQEQEGLIEKKAKEMEADALKEMEKLVNGI